MKLDHARARILNLWIIENNGIKHDDYTTFFQSARSFYDKLSRNNDEVLAFSTFGDQWQVVNRWIHEHEGYLHS